MNFGITSTGSKKDGEIILNLKESKRLLNALWHRKENYKYLKEFFFCLKDHVECLEG